MPIRPMASKKSRSGSTATTVSIQSSEIKSVRDSSKSQGSILMEKLELWNYLITPSMLLRFFCRKLLQGPRVLTL